MSIQQIVILPELEEVVFEFAQGDVEDAIKQATKVIKNHSNATQSSREIWLTLLDLFCIAGNRADFNTYSLKYSSLFGVSSPGWRDYDMLENGNAVTSHKEGVDWASPKHIGQSELRQLAALDKMKNGCWVMDFAHLENISLEAIDDLYELVKHWIKNKLIITWLNYEKINSVLAKLKNSAAEPIKEKTWRLHLLLCQMLMPEADFENLSLEYCMSYEKSPPETKKIVALFRTQPDAIADSNIERTKKKNLPTYGKLYLVGEILTNDIGEIKKQMQSKLEQYPHGIVIDCTNLKRIDFAVAGEILTFFSNNPSSDTRPIKFVDVNYPIGILLHCIGLSDFAIIKFKLN